MNTESLTYLCGLSHGALAILLFGIIRNFIQWYRYEDVEPDFVFVVLFNLFSVLACVCGFLLASIVWG